MAPSRAAAAAQVFVDDPADPVLSDPDRHHLAKVLRLQPGEPVVASDGRGHWTWCTFQDDALGVTGAVEYEPPPAPVLTVAFAPAKGERTEWAVQKLTELGVDRLVLLATARGVVRWADGRADRALARLGRVAVQAAAQSRRVWLPEVTGCRPLAELAADGPLALAQMGGPPLRASTSAIAVGPEGGWAPEELALVSTTVGLGPTVLRAETAAVAAGTVLSLRRAGIVS